MICYYYIIPKYGVTMYSLVIAASILAQAPSLWDANPIDVRTRINERIMGISAETPEVQSVVDQKIDNFTIRIYRPSTMQNLPAVLFIHGGGWVGGNLDTHDNLARYLCRGAQAMVVSVGYTNPPEGKFPLPLEQCYKALLWTKENINPSHLSVAGDSAGGNMAAALCLLARDRKGPTIDLQVLINPAPDLTGGGTIERQGDSRDTMRWYAKQYLANSKDANNPYVSPIVAKDLSGLPPALITLGELDDLRKDGQMYADRLIAAGVSTNVYIQWRIGHLAGNGARAAPCAQESLNIVVASLKGAFQKVQCQVK
jgi:acetyl esterase